jgi:hypothetical protein
MSDPATTEVTPKAWFKLWLGDHKALNPHGLWAEYERPGFGKVYQGWVRAFRLRGVSEADAREASRRMQGEADSFPNKQLPRLVTLALQAKAERERRERDQQGEERRAGEARSQELDSDAIAAWRSLPQTIRQPYLDQAEREYPDLIRRVPRFGEVLARKTWADEVLSRH